MASFLNSKPRRRAFKEAIRKQLQCRTILPKCYWGFSCPGTNCRPYFSDTRLNTEQNGMLVPRYGTLFSQHYHPIIATSLKILTSFESQGKTLNLMLLSVRRWILSITILTI